MFERHFGGYYHLAVTAALGGTVTEIGPAILEGTEGAVAEFSPDGSKVSAFHHADGSAWILDIAGGLGTRVSASSADPPSWQRSAL